MNAIDIQGISMQQVDISGSNGSYLLLSSETPLRTLNTTLWGGGFGYHNYIMNRHVDKNYDCADPIEEMDHFLQTEQYDSDKVAGMLTAAYVHDYGYKALTYPPRSNGKPDSVHEDDDVRVCSWVTMGLGNTARAGMERKPEELFPGTINMIILIDANLSDNAMANCIITATEAKAAALQDLGVRVKDMNQVERIATGTTTDAIVVAATGRGRLREYAGTATWIGHLIARTVYEAAIESGHNYNKAVLRR